MGILGCERQGDHSFPPRAVQEFLYEHEALKAPSVATALSASLTNGGAAAPIFLLKNKFVWFYAV